jgi:hypothetical protein
MTDLMRSAPGGYAQRGVYSSEFAFLAFIFTCFLQKIVLPHVVLAALRLR